MKKYGFLLIALFAHPVFAGFNINDHLLQTSIHQGSHIKNITISAEPQTTLKASTTKEMSPLYNYEGGALFGAKFMPAKGVIHVGESVPLKGNFDVYIENLTDKPESYKVTYSLVANPSDPNSQIVITDAITVRAQDYIEYQKSVDYNYAFLAPGKVKAVASVSFQPADGRHVYGTQSIRVFNPV